MCWLVEIRKYLNHYFLKILFILFSKFTESHSRHNRKGFNYWKCLINKMKSMYDLLSGLNNLYGHECGNCKYMNQLFYKISITKSAVDMRELKILEY